MACGLVKFEAGYAGLFAVHTATALRGQGLGRSIVSALLAEAARQGAHSAYLQVTADNAPALALYERFGFTPAYEYWYRGRPGEQHESDIACRRTTTTSTTSPPGWASSALARGVMLAAAESCTGGLVAGALTAVPGSSQWFERGFVTYSNEAKSEMLGVSLATLERCGAVSVETASEMAVGALQGSRADWSVAVTGVAGPDGGTALKPVGTVCFAWAGPAGRDDGKDTCSAGRAPRSGRPRSGMRCRGF